MIKEYEYLHGVVFTRICCMGDVEISIKPFKKGSYTSFVLNKSAGLYIKYCGKRLSPWRFSMTRNHQEEIEELKRNYNEVFVGLVCHLDGVVLLNYKELKSILDDIHDINEWICITRPKNKMYSVSASNGRLNFKIGKQSCPDKIAEYFRSLA